jgi:uncharacterized DUF497 family protein
VGITFDPAKRAKTLAERGLDFEDAAKVFAGLTLTLLDDRQDYGGLGFQTYGLLDGRLVMVVWTPLARIATCGSPRYVNEEV